MMFKKKLLLALLINLLFLSLYFAFGQVRFGSLDDYFMSSVLTGAYGSAYDIHTCFVNAAYGIFFKVIFLLQGSHRPVLCSPEIRSSYKFH